MIGISQPTAFLLSKARLQRNYLWDVLLPDIGPLWGIDTHGLVGFGLSQLVQSVTFGDYNITNPSIIKFGPYQARFAGLFEVKEVTISFLKTMPDAVSSYFYAWKKLIVGDDGLYFPKAHYQKTIYIRFLDSTGLAVGRYKLIGAFPSSFPSYDLGYENDKVTIVPVTLQVDKIEYEAF